MDLAEVQGRLERLGDPPGPAGVDGVAVAVASRGAGDQEVTLSWLALPQDADLYGAGPLIPFGGHVSGGHELDAGRLMSSAGEWQDDLSWTGRLSCRLP